jgi:hypothetical protein
MLRPPTAAQATRLPQRWRNTTSSSCPRAAWQRPPHARHPRSEHHGEATLHEARSEREPEPGALARAGQLRWRNTMMSPPRARPRPHSVRHAMSVSLALICAGHHLLHLTTAPPHRHRVTAQLLPCQPLPQELPHRPLPPIGSPPSDPCSSSCVDLRNDHEAVDSPPTPLETPTCRPRTRPAATGCEEDKSHAAAIPASFTGCAGNSLRQRHGGEGKIGVATARVCAPLVSPRGERRHCGVFWIR